MQIRRLAELGATTHQRLMQRSTADVQRVLPQVQAIMEGVREREDAAVEEFTARFDRVTCTEGLGLTTDYRGNTNAQAIFGNSPLKIFYGTTSRAPIPA